MTSIVFLQFGLFTSAVYVFSTSSCPALMSEGGWSSFEPAGPMNETSTKFGSIHETAGSRPSLASSRKLRGARKLLRSKYANLSRYPSRYFASVMRSVPTSWEYQRHETLFVSRCRTNDGTS